MLNPSGMRGLSTFISDIRACRSREQEEKRINKELANIRSKFKDGGLSGYDKKKYVCKLMYIYLLGFDIDFGHVEAVNLISTYKYSEKQIGYLAVTLLLTETNDLIRLVINSIRKDLEDRQEVFNCLALQAIANLGGREIAESLTQDVYKLLCAGTSVNFVKKKAALCLLRLYRKNPDVIPISDWSEKICSLMEDFDVGVNMCLCSLIIGLAQANADLLVSVVPKAINKLHGIVVEKMYTPDNLYYTVPSPWLQVKLLKLLQVFPLPTDQKLVEKINTIILAIFNTANEIPKNPQQNNALNAVINEAINLALYVNPESELVDQATNLAARYVVSKETNMKYIGLEVMTLLATYPRCLIAIKRHKEAVYLALSDKDVSVRRRAVDLLYTICDPENARFVVGELLQSLPSADHSMKEDMVLKIAILTERFAEDSTWYVDTTLKLIDLAGEHVSNEVWYRVIQIITNNEKIHGYAAKQVMSLLVNPACNEFVVKIAAYVLGEYGDLIANDTGCNPLQQFNSLHSKFNNVGPGTRAMMLTAYAKFINIFPEIKKECMSIFQQHKYVLDVEMQQRSIEYFALGNLPTDDLLQAIFDQMPPFPARESALIQRLKKNIAESEDEKIGQVNQQLRHKRGSVSVDPTALIEQTAREAGVPSNIPEPVTRPPPKKKLEPTMEEDLLGLGSAASAPPVVPATQEQINSWFLNFIAKPGGILYEDSQIQLGVKTEFQGASGRFGLFIGNKSQNAFHNFNISFADVSGLSVKLIEPVLFVAAMAQAQQVIQVDCQSSFIGSPIVNISFSDRQLPPLRLPVFLSKFLDQVQMAGPDYLNRWKALPPPKEIQEIFKSPKAVNVAAAKSTMQELHFHLLENVDPNPNNSVCAAVLHTLTIGKVGCLARLETNVEQAMFRLTIRATNEAVLKPLLECIKFALLK